MCQGFSLERYTWKETIAPCQRAHQSQLDFIYLPLNVSGDNLGKFGVSSLILFYSLDSEKQTK